jgi:hypothetical protein
MQITAADVRMRRRGYENRDQCCHIEAPAVRWIHIVDSVHRQLEAVVDHNGWTARENATHLAILQGQTANILHSPIQSDIERYPWGAEGLLRTPPADGGLQVTTQSADPAEQRDATRIGRCYQPIGPSSPCQVAKYFIQRVTTCVFVY